MRLLTLTSVERPIGSSKGAEMSPILVSSSPARVRASGPAPDPWSQVRLSIARDPYTSSDQVTLCRVRVVNHGPRSWPGRRSAFEARALGGGSVVRAARAVRPRRWLPTARSKRSSRFRVATIGSRWFRQEAAPRGAARTAARPGGKEPGRREASGTLQCARMKILVVGGGGREHALCSSLAGVRQSRRSSALPETPASRRSPTVCPSPRAISSRSADRPRSSTSI